MLGALDRQNLFLVPLDDHRRWYRYHHLFADVLHAHLLEERPGRRPRAAPPGRRLVRRARRPTEARSGTRWPPATSIVPPTSSSWPSRRCVARRREDVIRRWVDELPEDVVRTRPVLAIGLIGGLMASNEFGGVDQRLRDVERLLATPVADLVVVDRDELARLPAAVEMYRAALALIGGDPAGAIARAQRAIALRRGRRPDHRGRSGAVRAGVLDQRGHRRRPQQLLHRRAGSRPGRTHRGRAGLFDRDGRHGAEAGPAERRRAHARSCPRARPGPRPGRVDRHAGHRRHARRPESGGVVPQRPGRRGGATCAEPTSSGKLPAWRRIRTGGGSGWPASEPPRATRSAALELLDEAERVYVGDYSPNVQPVHATRARVLAARGDVADAARLGTRTPGSRRRRADVPARVRARHPRQGPARRARGHRRPRRRCRALRAFSTVC